MRIYFSGADRPNAIHILARAGARRVMVSFAEPPSARCWELYRRYGFEVIADSGAFSMWRRGARICLHEYMDWLAEHGIKKYFNLDVVGDPAATAANQAAMEAAGFSPVPVFHYGEPWDLLRQLVRRYPLVGLGGTVGLPLRVKEMWFAQVFTACPGGHFHALGIAREGLIRQFPFASADTTWWLCKFTKERRLVPASRKEEQLARIRYMINLESAPRTGFQGALPF